jgi:hypothetical protein
MIKVICCGCGADVTTEFLGSLGIFLCDDGVGKSYLDVDFNKLSELLFAEGLKDPVNVWNRDDPERERLRKWYERSLPNEVTGKETVYLCRVGVMVLAMIWSNLHSLCPKCLSAQVKELQKTLMKSGKAWGDSHYQPGMEAE